MILLVLVLGLPFPVARSQDSTKLRRLVIGKGSIVEDGDRLSVAGESSKRWYLGAANLTNKIDSAYRYGQHIVVFGWTGLAGLNTIIDAGTGAEVLEFLGYDPVITPDGLIVFRRFYPHFSDPAIVSDRIAVLNLNQQIPLLVPAKDQVPEENVGVDVFPGAAATGERHEIGGNFLIADQNHSLFLVERTSTGKLCVVRLPLINALRNSEKHYCLTAAELGGADPGKVHVDKFREQPDGDLVLSLDIPGSGLGSPPLVLQIDRQSLACTRIWPSGDKAGSRLRVPWEVQKTGVLYLAAADLGSREASERLVDVVEAEVTIDVYGRVIDVMLSGSNPEVLDRLRKTILSWKFKPTVLNGMPIEVVTRIVGPAGKFGEVPDKVR